MKTGIKKPSWKRVVLIGSIVVVAAAITIYVLASVQAWNTAISSTAQASSDLKQSVDSKLATETPPASVPVAIDEILKSYNDTLSQGPCQLPPLFEWQSNLPWLKDNRQACLTTAQAADELASSLTDMQVFYKQDAAAAVLVKQATEGTASTTDYTAAAATWQKVADDKSLITDDAFKPVGAKVIEVSGAIAAAYTSLAAANSKEDKAAFDAAQKALGEAYARLAEIQTTSTEAQAVLVDSVVEAYDNV
ncbi:MAG: hypothetical protein V4611_02645 [Patescibacteria group bacterium]